MEHPPKPAIAVYNDLWMTSGGEPMGVDEASENGLPPEKLAQANDALLKWRAAIDKIPVPPVTCADLTTWYCATELLSDAIKGIDGAATDTTICPNLRILAKTPNDAACARSFSTGMDALRTMMPANTAPGVRGRAMTDNDLVRKGGPAFSLAAVLKHAFKRSQGW
jgi:hypothetical protein